MLRCLVLAIDCHCHCSELCSQCILVSSHYLSSQPKNQLQSEKSFEMRCEALMAETRRCPRRECLNRPRNDEKQFLDTVGSGLGYRVGCRPWK